MSTVVKTTSIEWPTPVPIAAERLISGSPESSTLVLHSDARTEIGLWRITEGEFTTVHTGYTECIHIIEGQGRLVHDDGTAVPLGPEIIVLLEEGWRGRWVVDNPIVKSYTTTT